MLLIPILGDQLSHGIASLRGVDKTNARLLLMEVAEETTYVRHHKAKIVLILSAMRHFVEELRSDGWQIDYVRLDDPENTGSFTGEVARAIERNRPAAIRIVEAGEWRVQKSIEGWAERFGLPVEILSDDRFICPLPDFFAWAASRRELVMESFYRQQRRRTGLQWSPTTHRPAASGISTRTIAPRRPRPAPCASRSDFPRTISLARSSRWSKAASAITSERWTASPSR